MKEKTTGHAYAIIPIIIFVGIFSISGIILNNLGYNTPFSLLPSTIVAYIAVISCFLLFKGDLNSKFSTMVSGMTKPNTVICCTILILSGGFSNLTSAIGGTSSVVGLCLTYMPVQVITAGVFVACSIMALASGTSVGTIVAFAPISLSVASSANIPAPVMVGALLSGAMLGNNLSLISDATIASTGSLRVAQKGQRDKFAVSAMCAFPALIIALIVFLIFGQPTGAVVLEQQSFNIILIIPYVLVLITAFTGMNVMVCLSSGIIASAILSQVYGTLSPLEAATTLSSGMFNMANVMFTFLFISGMVAMVEKEGGLTWIISNLEKMIVGRRSAQVVSILISIVGAICIGNDTTPCIALGPILSDISEKYDVDPRKMASIMQTSTTTTAVIIPYSGVMLTTWGFVESAGFTNGFIEAVPFTIFPIAMLAVTVVSIFIPFTDKYLSKRPFVRDGDVPTT